MIIIVCLVIGLVGGLIIGNFAKKPEKNQNNGRSIGILFVTILGLSIFYLNQVSEIEKSIKNTNNENSNFISTVKTGSIMKSNNLDKTIKNNKLINLIEFKLLDYNLVEGDFSKNFDFGVELKNKSKKNILGYKGNFEIFDMFNDSLGKFNLNKIGNFNSGETLKEKLSFNYNEFISGNIKLGKSQFKDLKYKYNIEKIIYKDDYDFNNKVFGNNTGKDIDKIEYLLLNKKSKKGDFQNFIGFELNIKNNSKKDIKEIKGSFNIYNIFGKKLGNYEINLTKEIKIGNILKENI